MIHQRMFLFFALTLITMLLWQAWQEDYMQPPVPDTVSGKQPDNRLQTPSVPGQVIDQPGELPTLSNQSSLQNQSPKRLGQEVNTPPPVLPDTQWIHVITDKLDVLVNPQGGEISKLSLRDYPIALDKQDEPFVLLQPDTKGYYVAQSGLLSEQSTPNHLTTFQTAKQQYRMDEGMDELRVPLFWQSPEGVKVTKTLIFRRGVHLIDVQYNIENMSEQPWRGRQYSQIVRSTPEEASGMEMMMYTFNGAAYYSQEEKFEKIDFDDIAGESLAKDVTGGWTAMIQHYFLSAWIPKPNETNHFYTRALNNQRYSIGMISSEVLIQPGQQGQLSGRFYAGPKVQEKLEKLADGLELSVDYSWLTVVAKPIFWLMTFIHQYVVSNWGWTIILLTITIKLLFFKLSEQGYRSMANMRRVQPKLISIKERYGDDKRQMQRAMMELYKKEKINPMSGCFPILLQIPVFIALYWVLLESVELRQAPFILWIDDLSTKDPYFVLPILMGLTMILQQRLNPAPMDEIQKTIMKVLPIVFTVFFLFFPSGLVLYWVVNNVLSIWQQWVITRRIERGASKG